MQGDVLMDPDIRTLKASQLKFITVWNMGFQMFFLFLSLLCDIPIILKMKMESKYMKYIRSCKEILFSSVVWPLSVMIFTIFWPVFSIDRELIFPVFIDKAISLTSNHIMHTSILPIVLVELFFQRRSRPRSHKRHLACIAFIYISYTCVVLSNYAITGLWPYPFLYSLYGTIYFPILLMAMGLFYLTVYYVQWPLTESIHV